MLSIIEIALGLALLFGGLGFLLSCVSISLSCYLILKNKTPSFPFIKEEEQERLPLEQIFNKAAEEEEEQSKEINKVVDKMFFKIKEDKEPYNELD